MRMSEEQIRKDEIKQFEKWLFNKGYLFAEPIGDGEAFFSTISYVINQYRREENNEH